MVDEGTSPLKGTIVISPVTRIEGHAKVTIHLAEDGSVDEARFHVTDFRGFEKFCEGRPFYEMPSITSRSCGICPVSHLLASAKACDEIVSVNIPGTAIRLRRLMHMGQIIQSHALSFFHLSSPDLLLGMASHPSKRNIFGLMESHPDLARKGIRLRMIGQKIIEHLAGRRIHSSDWIVPGGVKWAIPKENADRMLSSLPEALKITLETISFFKDCMEGFEDEIENVGNFQTYHMGLVTPEGALEHYDGRIRIVDSSGNVVADQLDPRKYYEYIGEAVEPWTYMKFPYYKPMGYPKGVCRVGPLARLNIVSRCGTPLADEELKDFKGKFGTNGVVNSTFLYHYARLVELLFCVERAKELLEDQEIYSDNVQARAYASRSEGIGVAEAPRGTLIHHYKVDEDGIITWVNMIIATEINNLAYNMAVTQVAKKYINGKKLSEGLLNKVESVIRALDPCLSCATHAWGKMALEAQLFDSRGDLIDTVTR